MTCMGDTHTVADCLFCKIVAGEIPADVVHATERDGRVPRHQPAGADARAGRAARATTPNAAELAAGDPAGRRRAGHARPRRSPTAEGHDDYRLVFNTGAGRRPDRLPRPPAPARRPRDDLAARMSRAAPRASPSPAPPRCSWSPAAAPAAREPAGSRPATGPPTRAAARAARSRRRGPHGRRPRRPSCCRCATGEQRMTLRMPAAYTPSAPNGVGTDDYRCFLLDPQPDAGRRSSPAPTCCPATPTSCTT